MAFRPRADAFERLFHGFLMVFRGFPLDSRRARRLPEVFRTDLLGFGLAVTRAAWRDPRFKIRFLCDLVICSILWQGSTRFASQICYI